MEDDWTKRWTISVQVWDDLSQLKGILKEGLVKQLRDSFIYPLPCVIHGDDRSFLLSEPLEKTDHKLLIDCREQGGCFTNTGKAIIICGYHGEKMRPYFICQSGIRFNGKHASFSLEKMVSVTAVLEKGLISISIKKHYTVSKNGNGAKIIRTDVVWEGNKTTDDFFLPAEQEKFRPAVLAAIEKVQCRHCREPHFFATRNSESKIFFAFAVADNMFGNKKYIINREPLTLEEAKELLQNQPIISCCYFSHQATIAALRERLEIIIPIPSVLPKVELNTGDSIIVMSVRGLPRLTNRPEYTPDEIAEAIFKFSRYTVMQ